VKTHIKECRIDLNPCDIEILGSTTGGEKQLPTLEAFFQRDICPSIDKKDELKSRTLQLTFN
jgi:hypothetical protein